MTSSQLRDRLVARSLAGRYNLFFNVGALLAVAGAALFGYALTSGHSDRAWHLFHVNWLFFTGITGGSLALSAVHKVANAKWSGVLIRFAQANVFFALVSLAGLIAIFTVGYVIK